jgi:rSAM/selenodomain-associated transferase 2
MRLSIIIPTLDEAEGIETTLTALAGMRSRGVQIIVVDGGSEDGTPGIAAHAADVVMGAPRGRALQMNVGAQAAKGNALLFLHADSVPPAQADECVLHALGEGKRCWGRFDVHIAGANPLLRLVATLMNWRSRLTGIATGDQGMFMTRTAFEAVGGFPAIPLMEDIAMSRALKALSRPACVRERIATSGRRWERHGVLRTIALMWRLRAAYFFGADPVRLALRYRER